MTRVGRFRRNSARFRSISFYLRRVMARFVVVATFATSAIVIPFGGAEASSIVSDRATAAVLYRQILSIGSRVETFGQKYDLALINLHRFENHIKKSQIIVAQIERSVDKGKIQLRHDAVFAYVTGGAAASRNPLFSHDALQVESIGVYSQIAGGNIQVTLASLAHHEIELTRERSILYGRERQANGAARDASKAFHDANLLRASLEHSLGQVKGRIATFYVQQQAVAAAASAAVLQSAKPLPGFAAPPPSSVANIAIRAALGLIGVPYVWGGASPSGVDCSGLVLLAYAAAGVSLPHYSGSQYAATERVPLWNIQPGDLLFYGPSGGEHEAMYIGNGQMIEASSTGTLVHISPIRLGYGFVGLGRVRA